VGVRVDEGHGLRKLTIASWCWTFAKDEMATSTPSRLQHHNYDCYRTMRKRILNAVLPTPWLCSISGDGFEPARTPGMLNE
jgi:hypothetical protein